MRQRGRELVRVLKWVCKIDRKMVLLFVGWLMQLCVINIVWICLRKTTYNHNLHHRWSLWSRSYVVLTLLLLLLGRAQCVIYIYIIFLYVWRALTTCWIYVYILLSIHWFINSSSLILYHDMMLNSLRHATTLVTLLSRSTSVRAWACSWCWTSAESYKNLIDYLLSDSTFLQSWVEGH